MKVLILNEDTEKTLNTIFDCAFKYAGVQVYSLINVLHKNVGEANVEVSSKVEPAPPELTALLSNPGSVKGGKRKNRRNK